MNEIKLCTKAKIYEFSVCSSPDSAPGLYYENKSRAVSVSFIVVYKQRFTGKFGPWGQGLAYTL